MNTQRFFCFGLIAVALFGQQSHGQAAVQEKPGKSVFEAASIKKSTPQGSGNCKITPMRLRCTNYRLDKMIFWAYRLSPYIVQGMPSWAETAFYDVNASAEQENSAALNQLENHKVVLACLQDLFENRFHLKFHYEKQLRAGFRLLTSKGGLKIKPAADAKGGSSFSSKMVDGHRLLEFRYYTMANVANALTGELARPVVDATGIDGRYDFSVQMPVDDDATGSLFSALGDFGLKLEATKIETNIFVVDRLEKPTEN